MNPGQKKPSRERSQLLVPPPRLRPASIPPPDLLVLAN